MRPAALVVALLAPLALLATAPAATAQVFDDFEVDIGLFDGPIRPLSGSKEAPVSVEVSCGLVLRSPLYGVHITLEVSELPPWARAVITPSSLVIPPGCNMPTERVRADAVLSVVVDATAPAFEGEGLVVAAVLEAEGLRREASGDTTVVAGYAGAVSLLPETAHADVGRKRSAVFPIEVANHANGATRLSFEVSDVTEGFEAVAPSSRIVSAGGVDTVNFVVETPAGMRSTSGRATLIVTAHFENNPLQVAAGDSATFVIETGSSVAREVPAPAPTVVVGVLAFVGAVHAARRRRPS